MGDDIDDAVRLHRLGERHEALESSGFESNPQLPDRDACDHPHVRVDR
jgi:hypothetical protein